jgi:phthiodiolone/phenolphthiodiolone dimycocerosates ketoreductase
LEIFSAPLIKAFVLQIPAAVMQQHGFEHPLGPHWRGYHDVDPALLSRDKILAMLAKVDPRAILAVIPHGTPAEIAKVFKDYADAGMRVAKILDYSGMAGLAYAPRSAQKVREAEDEWMRLLGPCA